MRDVAIIGVGMIPFGRRDQDSLVDMLAYASLKALDDAQLGDKAVDAVYVANMGGGILQHQTAIASALVDRLRRTGSWPWPRATTTWCWWLGARRCVR